MKILITGSSGYLGQSVLNELRNHTLTGYDLKTTVFSESYFNHVTGDILKYGHLIATNSSDVQDFFYITLSFNYQSGEGNYYDIIIHSPRLLTGTASMIADVYTYTLIQ